MDDLLKLIGGFIIDLYLRISTPNFYWGKSYSDYPILSLIIGLLVMLLLGVFITSI